MPNFLESSISIPASSEGLLSDTSDDGYNEDPSSLQESPFLSEYEFDTVEGDGPHSDSDSDRTVRAGLTLPGSPRTSSKIINESRIPIETWRNNLDLLSTKFDLELPGSPSSSSPPLSPLFPSPPGVFLYNNLDNLFYADFSFSVVLPDEASSNGRQSRTGFPSPLIDDMMSAVPVPSVATACSSTKSLPRSPPSVRRPTIPLGSTSTSRPPTPTWASRFVPRTPSPLGSQPPHSPTTISGLSLPKRAYSSFRFFRKDKYRGTKNGLVNGHGSESEPTTTDHSTSRNGDVSKPSGSTPAASTLAVPMYL